MSPIDFRPSVFRVVESPCRGRGTVSWDCVVLSVGCYSVPSAPQQTADTPLAVVVPFFLISFLQSSSVRSMQLSVPRGS